MIINEIDIQVKLAQLREMQSDAEWQRIVNQAWADRPRQNSNLLRRALAGLGRDMIGLGGYLQERYSDCTMNTMEPGRQPAAR
jgi:hypothetical protein